MRLTHKSLKPPPQTHIHAQHWTNNKQCHSYLGLLKLAWLRGKLHTGKWIIYTVPLTSKAQGNKQWKGRGMMGAERRESPAILAVKHSWCHGLPKHAWHHHLHLYNEDVDMSEGLWWTRTWISVVKDGYGSSVARALVADAHPVVQIKVVSQAKQEQEVRSIPINFLHTFMHEWLVWG